MSVGVSTLLSQLNKVLYVQYYTWYSTLHSGKGHVSVCDFTYCLLVSEYPKNPLYVAKFDKFRPKLVEGRDGLEPTRGEKVAVGSGLGPKAGNWQQVLLFLGGLKLHYSHPLAARHTRQGVAISKGSMSAVHQIGGVLKG
ncbi:hypothetical protein E2C01_034290 [Portunus trituberculatus]|uniref:Uncharacterized protein n=1 Tax=Portunus trituberculatus TaxID=210409 RepID=A0A5B7F564_PORTR|nr:hypothetical protein [Portunus trituberculatus]